MNKLHEWMNTAAIVAVLIVVLVGGNQSVTFGAKGTRLPNGISADTTSPVAGEVRGTDLTITDDATISGGVLNVPTAANATSTLTVGCLSAYATSSATQIKLAFNTSATSTAINGGTVQGVVLWQYGSCPV